MKRREFLKSVVTGTAGAAAGITVAGCGDEKASAGPEQAVHTRKKVRWRLASSFPPSLDTIFGSAEVLAQRLDALSDGNFTIRVHSAGELVPPFGVLEAVQEGTVQIGHTASYYYTGKNKALAFDTCVPFGLNARQQNAWLLEGGGLELMRGLFVDFNIINFPAGNTGVQMGGWFKREIGSAADLKGLKIRIPGMGGEVMDRLGATVQQIPGGEILPALERGALDATEWVGPYDDEKLGFHKVAKYYYYPGWWEPGPSLSYYVNQGEWAKLSKDFQAMFRSAAADSAVVMQTRYDQRNPAALQRLLAGGTQLRRFSDDLMTAAREASQAVLEDAAAADPSYRAVYDQWSKARRDTFRWFATAEAAYSAFAFG
jgi:TRAP-type mannitol/chloroaromatic compound transport system substrate-binding protein